MIRFRMRREKLNFSREIRLIPRRLVWIMLGLLIVAQVYYQITFWNHVPIIDNLSPEMNALLLGGGVTVGWMMVAVIVFLAGYVYRDAKRRGMNSTLWTLFVIVLVPIYLFVGFLIYFIIREPLPFNCPECSTKVSARFNYCPKCKYNLRPVCPKCSQEVYETDRFCPNCANDLAVNPQQGQPMDSDIPTS